MKKITPRLILLSIIITSAILATACSSSSKKQPTKEEKAAQLTYRTAVLTTLYATNPDSLALGIRLIDQAIKLAPDSPKLYELKAQNLCLQKKYDKALLLLDSVDTQYGSSWSRQFYQAVIYDFTGDTVSAKLNYERMIEYCEYKLKKMDPKSFDYENMVTNCITAKLLRYGKESTKADIEALKTGENYYEGSFIYYSVIGLENFEKEAYLKRLIAPKEDDLKGRKETLERLMRQSE